MARQSGCDISVNLGLFRIFGAEGLKRGLAGLIGFRTKRVFVLFVGAHAEYDKIDVATL